MKKTRMFSKRAIIVIIATFMFGFLFIQPHPTTASAAVQPDSNGAYHATIYINGTKQDLESVITAVGSTMVPYRALFDALDINAQFDNQTKTITATSNGKTIVLHSGDKTAQVNGEPVHLIQAPAISGGAFYVNLRFIAETYDATVTFDKSTLSVYIDFPEQDADKADSK